MWPAEIGGNCSTSQNTSSQIKTWSKSCVFLSCSDQPESSCQVYTGLLREVEARGSPMGSCMGFAAWRVSKFESCLQVGALRRALGPTPEKPENSGTQPALSPWRGLSWLQEDPRPPRLLAGTHSQDGVASRCKARVGMDSFLVICPLPARKRRFFYKC